MLRATAIDIAAQAAQLALPTRGFVNGEWVELSGEPLSPISPRDGRHLPEISSASPADVASAVSIARECLISGSWAGLDPRSRGQRLIAIAARIQESADELALLISLEMGKPIQQAREVELPAVIRCLAWYGEAADKLLNESPVTAPDTLSLITREPAGVVAAVVPWNFPLTMAIWKIAPALLAGNSVILKPAENSTYSALRLAELFHEAGLPAGALAVLPGPGAVTGRALGESHDIDVLTFTGSPEIGRRFLEYSAHSNGKRVWPELGGKTASLVLPDADLTRAVTETAAGCFFNQGQMCTSASRLLIPESALEAASEIAVEVATTMKPADPLDPTATQGAIASASHLQRIQGFVERALTEGGKLLAGSTQPTEPVPGGSYFAPVVLRAAEDSEIARSEVFGPVLTILTYRDLDHALEIANSTSYGLASALWTDNLSQAHQVSRALKTGIVWVNCFEEGDMTMPFGGVKESGYGRDKSLHAIDKYTDLKSTWIKFS